MIVRVGIVVLALLIGAERLFASDLPPIRLSPGAPSIVCEYGNVQRASVPDNTFRNVSIQTENWTWQMFPQGFIYPNYLAAVQNRLGGAWNRDNDINWIWDITLGGRAPLLRYGNRSAVQPEGWQLDLEGSVHLRLDLRQSMDMEANDFRFGLPLSYGTDTWQIRTGYYHVSTHTGDERILRNIVQDYKKGELDISNLNPGHGSRYRLNYFREALLFGYAYRPTPNTRLYAEADYAFMQGERTKPWHFQFGAEYSPRYTAQGWRGTPFAAVNARLMQEFNFDGNITFQTGWQWRGSRNELFRIGMQYFAGVSDQYSFIAHPREHKIGVGVWYDF